MRVPITLITSPDGRGITKTARRIAEQNPGPLRCPHHSVGHENLMAEARLATGGTLLILEPLEFGWRRLHILASTWRGMEPADRPEIVVGVGPADYGEGSRNRRLLRACERFTIDEHVTPADFGCASFETWQQVRDGNRLREWLGEWFTGKARPHVYVSAEVEPRRIVLHADHYIDQLNFGSLPSHTIDSPADLAELMHEFDERFVR